MGLELTLKRKKHCLEKFNRVSHLIDAKDACSPIAADLFGQLEDFYPGGTILAFLLNIPHRQFQHLLVMMIRWKTIEDGEAEIGKPETESGPSRGYRWVSV